MSKWSVLLHGCNIVLLCTHLPYNYVKPLFRRLAVEHYGASDEYEEIVYFGREVVM